MKKKNVRIDLITIDAGTQHRQLDEDVVRRYLGLMADGVEFPPVEVVSDGVNFWLWDGFHRYGCAYRRADKTITAFVTKGTFRDAIWLSFSANREHGLPRQRGIAKTIIEQILADKTWSKKSLSAIARHVGVTKQYVSQIKDELTQEKVSTKPPKTGQNDDSEPKTAQGSTSLPLSRANEIEVETKTGIPYTQRSQEKEKRTVEPPKDNVGRIIPEHLRGLYEDRKTIRHFVTDLARIRDGVIEHVDERDPVFSLLNTTAFQANYENLRRTLKSAMPYAVCPICGGDGKQVDGQRCRTCEGFGLLNEPTYKHRLAKGAKR